MNTAIEWWGLIQEPHYWWQLLCILLAVAAASLLNRRVQNVLNTYGDESTGLRHIASRSLKRLLWPVSSLALMLPAKAILERYETPVQLMDIAISILLALALIRVCIYILRKGFTYNPILKSSENFLATVIWAGVALHLLGWLPAVMELLDSVGLNIGESRVTVLSSIQLVLMVGLAFTLALWLAGMLSNWLKNSEHVTPSMQIGFSKFIRFLLLTLAFLIALNAVGINLGSLAIFGGALGVGLGFGLQRITSNFISGFILVMDRSIKPGDVITVGDKYGWVEELNARYLVVRNREGVDTLIPNENLITSEVINWSYADKNVRVTVDVQISYGDDPEQAMALMMDCAYASPRVLHDPVPSVRMLAFEDSGIALQLRIWIADPQNGSGAVRSDVNLAIWRAFKAAGITIPFPQRDLHIKSGLPSGLTN
ncbi:MAG: mechanosensitive ion channel protein MscS [Pseudomonadaceae bacterium]|nr:MAG: mechanosensitive ion channel protein MscS [Pseudomonadaceae bacterium]